MHAFLLLYDLTPSLIPFLASIGVHVPERRKSKIKGKAGIVTVSAESGREVGSK